MNPILRFFLSETLKHRQREEGKKASRREIYKEAMSLKVDFRHFFQNAVFILLGVLSAGFGLKGFLLPNAFIDGGITGVSLIINHVSSLSISLLIVVLNIPFIILAFNTVSRSFAISSN